MFFGKTNNDDSNTSQIQLDHSASLVDAISRSMAMIEFKPSGEIITANHNFLQAVGYSLEEIQGQHHRIFCEPDLAASSEYSAFWHKLNQGEFCSGLFKRVNKAGETMWLEATYNPVFDSEKNLIKIVKFAADITERVIEQTKRHSYIASLLQISHVIVCINKMDLVEYKEDVFNEIVAQYEGISSKMMIKDVRYIPISALEGDNVVHRSTKMPWYQNAPLLKILPTSMAVPFIMILGKLKKGKPDLPIVFFQKMKDKMAALCFFITRKEMKRQE